MEDTILKNNKLLQQFIKRIEKIKKEFTEEGEENIQAAYFYISGLFDARGILEELIIENG